MEDRVTVVLEHQRRAVPIERLPKVKDDVLPTGGTRHEPVVHLEPCMLVLDDQQLLLLTLILEPRPIFTPHHTGCGDLVADRIRLLFRLLPKIGDHRRNRRRTPGPQTLTTTPGRQHLRTPLTVMVPVALTDPILGITGDYRWTSDMGWFR